MTQEEKTRQLFSDLIAPYLVQQSSDIKQTNIALLGIEKHLGKINGTIEKHDNVIRNNLPHTVLNCPQAEVIDEIHNAILDEERVKEFKKSQKEEKRGYSVMYIMLAGVIISLLFNVYNASSNRTSREQNSISIQQGIETMTKIDDIQNQVCSNSDTIRYNTQRLNDLKNR